MKVMFSIPGPKPRHIDIEVDRIPLVGEHVVIKGFEGVDRCEAYIVDRFLTILGEIPQGPCDGNIPVACLRPDHDPPSLVQCWMGGPG